MELFNITYEDLIRANKSKDENFDDAYKPLLDIKDPWENLDLIIDFVRRWNTRVPIAKNGEIIKDVLLNLKGEFETLKYYSLEDMEFNSVNIMSIKNIFSKLSETVLKYTGTTKLMHGINPCLFVMRDQGICMHYGCHHNSTGYIIFLKLMQEQIQRIFKEHDKKDMITETGRTLPKLIDEYNWMNYRTSKSIY